MVQENLDIESSNKGIEKVDHPSHYNEGKVETLEHIKQFMADDAYIGFLQGNIMKYLHRYKYKNGKEDLLKAKWYLEELIKFEYPT